MNTEKTRRPSPLQRNILIVLAAMEQRSTTPVRTLDLEQLLEQGGDRPVYGPNLRSSCHRMAQAGWLKTLYAKNLELSVELTAAGRALAAPLLAAEQAADNARRRAADVRVLPVRPENGEHIEREVTLDGTVYQVWRGDFVVRLDGSTCLQLWHMTGQRTLLDGDALQVATWYEACFTAGLTVQCQVN